MAAHRLFKMENPYYTCTAASLMWCNMMLRGSKPKASHFEKDNQYLQSMMHTVGIGSLDRDPATQVGLAQFQIVDQGASNITSRELTLVFKAHPPHIGIFWNSFHTMAYRYHHEDKRYFDNNHGLWKAKLTTDIVDALEDARINRYNGAPWCGYAVVDFGNRLWLP